MGKQSVGKIYYRVTSVPAHIRAHHESSICSFFTELASQRPPEGFVSKPGVLYVAPAPDDKIGIEVGYLTEFFNSDSLAEYIASFDIGIEQV